VHCLVTPVIVAVLPLFGWFEALEPALFALSGGIGLWEARSGARVHGRAIVWLPVLLGIASWVGALLVHGHNPWIEGALAALGGILVGGALFWNGRLRHRIECATQCACPAPHG